MKTILFCLSFAAFCIFQTQSVFACTCVEISNTPAEYAGGKLKSADAVFSGKVISSGYRKMTEAEIKSISDKNFPFYGNYFNGQKDIEIKVINFEIYRWWKGFDDKKISLLTGIIRTPGGISTSNSCEIDFEDEKEYFVFAYGNNKNSLRTSACSGTTTLENTASYMEFLGEGKTPEL